MNHNTPSSRKRSGSASYVDDDKTSPPPLKRVTRSRLSASNAHASDRVQDDARNSQADEWSTPYDFEERIMESSLLKLLKIYHRRFTVPFERSDLEALSFYIQSGDSEGIDKQVKAIDRWFASYPQTDSASEQEAVAQVREKWKELKNRLEPPSKSLRDQSVLDGQDALAPSQAAKAPVLREQQTTHPMAIGRGMNTLAPPISLFHPIFSRFKTLLETQAQTGIDDGDGPLAFQLLAASSDFYSSEDLRLEGIMDFLSGLLKRDVARIRNPKLMQCDPDGVAFPLREAWHLPVPGAPPVLVMEAKNEVGEGGSDPDFQAALAYRKIVSNGKYENARKACCSPCFLLSVAGPRLAIYGGIHTDTFIAQPLARPLYLFGEPDTCAQANEVAHFFRALRTCLEELDEFYTHLDFDAENPHVTHPYHQKIGQFTLEYSGENLLQHSLGRAMFKAQMKKPNEESTTSVFVKFTPSYGEQAHSLLAKQGLAPTLHCCEELENGWKAVVMDEISGSDLTAMGVQDPFPERILKDVKKAIELLHAEEFVFGDLRPGNIIVYDCDVGGGQMEKRAMLVDFDWAGKAKVQRYPYSLNLGVKWPKGVEPGSHMEPSHDLEMLQRLVSALGSDHPPPGEAAS